MSNKDSTLFDYQSLSKYFVSRCAWRNVLVTVSLTEVELDCSIKPHYEASRLVYRKPLNTIGGQLVVAVVAAFDTSRSVAVQVAGFSRAASIIPCNGPRDSIAWPVHAITRLSAIIANDIIPCNLWRNA